MKKAFLSLIALTCFLGIIACSKSKSKEGCANGCGVANHRICSCGCMNNNQMDNCRCDAQCSCKNPAQ